MVNLVELIVFFSCNVLSCNGDFSFLGKLYVGPEVDFLSCGVVLYALLSSTLPFDLSKFSKASKLALQLIENNRSFLFYTRGCDVFTWNK
jgi:serine/threonine protein kinase